jgi:hypothetical protein
MSMTESFWDFLYYPASWLAFATISFLIAFMKELTGRRKSKDAEGNDIPFILLPPEKQQKILTDCAIKASEWFQYGLYSSFCTFITEFAITQSLDAYLTIDGLILVAAVVFTPLLGKEAWIKIGHILKILAHKIFKTPEERKLLKELKRKEKDAKKIEKLEMKHRITKEKLEVTRKQQKQATNG